MGGVNVVTGWIPQKKAHSRINLVRHLTNESTFIELKKWKIAIALYTLQINREKHDETTLNLCSENKMSNKR